MTTTGHHYETTNSVSLCLQGAYSHSLAEWALTACSWFAKDLPRLKRQQKDRNWESYYVEELRSAYLTEQTVVAFLLASADCSCPYQTINHWFTVMLQPRG